jgi:predicted N-acyltransferase
LSTRTARIVEDIGRISREDWNACAQPDGAPHNPFLRHEFLHALETSRSACAKTGWRPCHVLLEDGGTCVGVVPMYLKSHSQGEYVFDHNWADAWHRAGGRYYPKLQISVPFTPATGRRFLARNDDPRTVAELLDACIQVATQLEVSSLHATFVTEAEWSGAPAGGYLQRMDRQFHWYNRGYGCFEDFLGDLAAKKRKNLKRERRDALANGIEIEWVTGSDLREAHWDAFFKFYLDTGSRKWGSPYLTREFFSRIGESMPEDVLLILCKRAGRYVAGALNFIGGDTLFGRNWGCIEDHPFLHFEACYYQAIDFAIARGLARVEAGAQGGHKIARGYRAAPTYSIHWIADPRFRAAIADYLEAERRHVAQEIAYVEEHGPFRSTLELGELRIPMHPPESP